MHQENHRGICLSHRQRADQKYERSAKMRTIIDFRTHRSTFTRISSLCRWSLSRTSAPCFEALQFTTIILKCNFVGLQYYTISQTLITCRSMHLRFVKLESGNIVKQFTIYKQDICTHNNSQAGRVSPEQENSRRFTVNIFSCYRIIRKYVPTMIQVNFICIYIHNMENMNRKSYLHRVHFNDRIAFKHRINNFPGQHSSQHIYGPWPFTFGMLNPWHDVVPYVYLYRTLVLISRLSSEIWVECRHLSSIVRTCFMGNFFFLFLY